MGSIPRAMVAHAARSSAVVALAVACLFLCVADCSAQASPKASPACSRERSRHARAVLDEFFHPVVDKNRFELPPACPFARAKDMYLEHERHKEVVRRTQYKSLYSDKTFKSEYYVDKHMDNRHRTRSRRARTCAWRSTATSCGATRFAAGARRTPRRASSTRWMPSGSTRMNATRPSGGRARARRASALVARCFPSREAGVSADAGVSAADAAAARLRAYFSKQHCGFLTCGGVRGDVPRDGGAPAERNASACVRVARGARAGGVLRGGGEPAADSRRTWRGGGAGAGSASSARKPRRSSPAFSRASG